MQGVEALLAALITYLRWLVATIQGWIRHSTGQVISFDSGIQARLLKQIGEGGFSFVFLATNVETNETYAIKRVSCADPELLERCRREAGVHRRLNHANTMPLLGLHIAEQESLCYMAFPFIPRSLRAEINERLFEASTSRPLPEPKVWLLMHRIVKGLKAVHEIAQVSHRDIKPENILLKDRFHPVLMDFGSAGVLRQPISTRREILTCIEEASIHTTMAYRPPELFDGILRPKDEPVDFAKVDVWSLGCTFHAMLYGASPSECEFPRNSGDGRVKITECTHLSVLKEVPEPSATAKSWFSSDIRALITTMLQQDRRKRPTLKEVVGLVGNHVEDTCDSSGFGWDGMSTSTTSLVANRV